MGGHKLFVVGVGASAGGLEAITQLIAELKPGLPCAFVVLQHLSPSYRSMMVEILGRETALVVREAAHGDIPAAGTIYVVPANHNALYKEGRLHLVSAPPEVVPKPSINQFLISLAAEEGESAVGVVLSGTGSDGVAGLRAIQAAGGFTLVQAPQSAKYDGMPRAAIDAGVADHILTPDEIARRLPDLLSLPAGDAVERSPDLLEALLGRVRQRLQFDFSGYKTGTLMRRIRRREVATGCADLAAYVRYVEEHPAEIDHLTRDILISVTAFFRDREAFDFLRGAVVRLCAQKSPGSEIRAWVAGCASGEEAYSIAILFAEALGERLSQYRIQIFATDIDDEALNTARRGLYPAAAMSEVPRDLLDRYFQPACTAFEAGKCLRDLIVFARHNLVSDPPFLRLDLISCRNVLIYFDAPLQARVLQTFHFGLVRDGHLFLGRSESVAQAEQLFVAIERRERLFRKSGDVVHPPQRAAGPPPRSAAQERDPEVGTLLGGLVAALGVVGVLCDGDGNVRHTVGEVGRYLSFPQGSARMLLIDAVAPALRGELLALMHRAHKQRALQRGRRRRLDKTALRLLVAPTQPDSRPGLVVLFVPEHTPAESAEPAAASARQLEDELLVTREHLQTLVEEMATANEEMQALNEEAQASNEELQATNEELEAANEELQATNEELISLNEELNVKTGELSQLTEEYAHLYDALRFPILVFDRQLALQRFNASAARAFDLRATAIRQPLARLRLPEFLQPLGDLLGRVLAHGDREELVLRDEPRVFTLSVTPGVDRTGQVGTLVVTLVDVSEVARTRAALDESEARLSALMEQTTILFAMKDLAGNYLFANRRCLEFFGFDPGAYVGQSGFALLPPALAADLWALDLEALRTRAPASGEHRVEREGSARVLRSVHQVLLDGTGRPTALITEAEDVTAQKNAEEQLRITAKVFDQTGEAIIVTDPRARIQTANTAFFTITGYTPDEVRGRTTALLKSGRHSAEFYAQMWQRLNADGFWQGEVWNRRKNGEVYPEWLTINRLANERGEVEHYIAVFSDISAMKESQRKAEYLATHDMLTGLPNRALFQDRLRHALAVARRERHRIALLFIDLDLFKTINDTLGHDVGDRLLVEVAQRLREIVRDVDTVARLGGDEFTAVLAACDSEGADLVARRVVDDLGSSFVIDGRTLFVSASVGVAFYPEDGGDSTSLIKAADSAMYRAKEVGRNRVEYFQADLQIRLLKRATLENGLREALRRDDRLRLVFQPQYALAERRLLVGAEALLRWRDPVLGDVSPGDFIPVAEASGLITEVGVFVREALLDHLARWRAYGLAVPPVAFNVAPRCMRENDFSQRLIAELARRDLPASSVRVEITEGALLENSATVLANLDRLAQARIGISIDDFGTGYSSLAYLKRLPLSELKIDKTFVDGVGEEAEDEAIARAILALARSLGMTVVAEGVETAQQLVWLQAHGCEAGQGYFLSRPLEAAVFEDLLAKEGGRDAG